MGITVARDLGLAVRGRRLELGISQAKLAAKAGVSRKWLSEFEQGKPSAEIGMMLRILDAVQLQVHLEASGPQPAAASGPTAVDLDALLDGLSSDDDR